MITVKKSEYNKAKLRKLFREASQQYIQITDEEAQELGLIEQEPTEPTGEQEPEIPTGETEPQGPTGNTEPQEHEEEDLEHDYLKDYLTFEALEDDCQFSINNDNFQYSLDNGNTWIILNKDELTPNINKGQKILWKQYGLVPNNGIGTYSSNKKFNASGNIMSILFGDDFKDKTDFGIFSEYKHIFYYLFTNNKIYNALKLILPATTLTEACYYRMFKGCSSLITAPELPALVLAYNCYNDMFKGCSSLITAPELPALKLADQCYGGMFNGCTSLTTAPILSALKLETRCYNSMFANCTSLNYVKCLAKYNVDFGMWHSDFLTNVAENGVFIKYKNVEYPDDCIPEYWEIIEVDE